MALNLQASLNPIGGFPFPGPPSGGSGGGSFTPPPPPPGSQGTISTGYSGPQYGQGSGGFDAGGGYGSYYGGRGPSTGFNLTQPDVLRGLGPAGRRTKPQQRTRAARNLAVLEQLLRVRALARRR